VAFPSRVARLRIRRDRDAEGVHHLAGGPLAALDPAVQVPLAEGRSVLAGEVDRSLAKPQKSQKSVYWPGPKPA
jgi:hypothetical protein